MAEQFTDADDALLAELGVEVVPEVAPSCTPEEERVIAGFADIQRFVAENGHTPRQGAGHDIFERLYAVRLVQIRKQEKYHALLAGLDHQGLLTRPDDALAPEVAALDDAALLAELGIEVEASGLTELRHVRTAAEKRAAEEIARRERCADFERFRPLFEQVQQDLDQGLRQTRRFERKAEIAAGRFYILGGQKAFVAAMEEPFTNEQGNVDARLRVIFDNGTESNLLLRSLQKALQQDAGGRRIIEPQAGPLFGADKGEADEASGTIYVLRSKSDAPEIAAHHALLHKIGVTGGDLQQRLANAAHDPTYLMAGVEVMATYELFNIDRARLEQLIHRIFAAAQLEIEIRDRFGKPVVPREWFLVPLFVIDEAVQKIRDGTITDFVYDPEAAALVRRNAGTKTQ